MFALMSLPAMSLGVREQKGWAGGGGSVHLKGVNSMACLILAV